MNQEQRYLPEDRDGSPVRAVARAIDILFAIAGGPLTLGEIAQRTGLTKGTCHRLLASLGYRQLALQDPRTGSYLLGPGCFRFVEAIGSGLGGLDAIARPILEELRRETEETVTLHVRIGGQRICVAELPSHQAVRYTAGVGSAAPVHVGSAGKTLLAFMNPDERKRLLTSLDLQAITPGTITELDALVEGLEGIRRQGWASSRGERVPGAAAVSVPIKGPEGPVVAALSILAPETRLPVEREPRIRDLLQAAAINLSRQMRASSGAHVSDEVRA